MNQAIQDMTLEEIKKYLVEFRRYAEQIRDYADKKIEQFQDEVRKEIKELKNTQQPEKSITEETLRRTSEAITRMERLRDKMADNLAEYEELRKQKGAIYATKAQHSILGTAITDVGYVLSELETIEARQKELLEKSRKTL